MNITVKQHLGATIETRFYTPQTKDEVLSVLDQCYANGFSGEMFLDQVLIFSNLSLDKDPAANWMKHLLLALHAEAALWAAAYSSDQTLGGIETYKEWSGRARTMADLFNVWPKPNEDRDPINYETSANPYMNFEALNGKAVRGFLQLKEANEQG